jgi:hypothetical protein
VSVDEQTNDPVEDQRLPAARPESLALFGCAGTLATPVPLILSFLRDWGPITKTLLILGLLLFGFLWIFFTAQGLRERSLVFLRLRSTIASYVFLAVTGVCVVVVTIVAQTTKSNELESLLYFTGVGWIAIAACFVTYIFWTNLKVTQSISLTIATSALQLLNLLLVTIIYLLVWLARDHEYAQEDQERFLRRRALQRYDGL